MIRKILNGDYLSRLDNIVQWQEKNRLHNENVGSHSLKVTVFTRVLLEDSLPGFSPDTVQFKLDCVTLAMFHDFDEALILRDISHETKYNDFNGEEIRKAINDYARYLSQKEFQECGERGFTDVFQMLFNNICCPNEDVKQFVKLADWLALLYNLNIEKGLGNKHDWVDKCLTHCRQSIGVCADSVVEILERRFPNNVELSELKQISHYD